MKKPSKRVNMDLLTRLATELKMDPECLRREWSALSGTVNPIEPTAQPVAEHTVELVSRAMFGVKISNGSTQAEYIKAAALSIIASAITRK